MSDPSQLALIIGIDSYSKDLDPLPSCKKDAEDIFEIFSVKGYTIYENGPLIGSTLEAKYGWVKIRNAISNFFMRAKPSQKLIFYFSDHGISKGNEVYLGTPEIDPENPFSEGFAVSDLTKLMSNSKSKQIVGIIDACHSGAAYITTKPKAAKEDANRALAIYDRIKKRIPKAKGISLLLSSQDYESSFAPANSNNENSSYTRHLIAALHGVKPILDKEGRYIEYTGSVDDYGDVSPNSVHEYIYNKVASENEEQTPRFTSSTSSKMVILHYPELAAKPKDRTITEHLLTLLQEGRVDDFNNSRKDNPNIRLDYRGINLNGLNLAGAELGGISFSEATLDTVNLERSSLIESNFSDGTLKKVNLKRANLEGAKLQGSHFDDVSLDQAILRGANLQGTKVVDSSLRHTNLVEANLENADLKKANLENADLAEALLDGANLDRTFLRSANLQGASLRNSKLKGLDLTVVNLDGASLKGADIEGANLQGSKLSRMLLDGCSIRDSNLQNSDFADSLFSRLTISNTNLQRSNLNRAVFRDVRIDGTVNMNQALLIDSKIENLHVFGIVTFNEAKIESTIISAVSDISITSDSRGIIQLPTQTYGSKIGVNSWLYEYLTKLKDFENTVRSSLETQHIESRDKARLEKALSRYSKKLVEKENDFNMHKFEDKIKPALDNEVIRLIKEMLDLHPRKNDILDLSTSLIIFNERIEKLL
jgi:uncharacterized protein YjbI with pentapeptide repeats